MRVGIVAFAGSAQLAQLPTQNHEDLFRAIDSFQLQRGTATGNGILLSLATLFPDTGIDVSRARRPPGHAAPAVHGRDRPPAAPRRQR